MHVALSRTKDRLKQPVEFATIAGEEMLPWLEQIEGFEGLLMLSNQADGTTFVLSFWESRDVADAHRAARMQFRDRVASTVNVEVVETGDYEVTFARVGQLRVPLGEDAEQSG